MNHLVTKHCGLLKDAQLFFCNLCLELFSAVNIVSKISNINYLLIELLYKIKVTFAIILIFRKTKFEFKIQESVPESHKIVFT